MQERLRKLMQSEGLNSTRLAEMLQIQASGISHIMSGRNMPSFDFLTKLLRKFPQINPDWLLLGTGPMYRDAIKKRSKSETAQQEIQTTAAGADNVLFPNDITIESTEPDNNDIIPAEPERTAVSDPESIENIIVCYADNSCKIYKLRN